MVIPHGLCRLQVKADIELEKAGAFLSLAKPAQSAQLWLSPAIAAAETLAPADKWQLGFIMLGANIHSIPAPPPPSDPIIGINELFEEVTTKWKLVKVALEDPFHAVSSQASFSSIKQLMKVYTRAFETLNRLEKDFRAW
ncbi:hypothetical protein EDB85DRAFT_1888300 [Lactarius pseudohatsudake]|nr:hypothetical protein EDB85DRAFT_1888300 [Lactarius pseudohatsudake]